MLLLRLPLRHFFITPRHCHAIITDDIAAD